MAAGPNYQLLYQLNPNLFSNNASLADALYGIPPGGEMDTNIFRQLKAFGNDQSALLQAQADPSGLFPQAQQFFSGTPQGGQGQVPGAAPVMPRMPPPQAVVDPNNLPAPIFRYR